MRSRPYDALCSAASHLVGMTDGKPPSYVIRAAQSVIATSVGVKFAGTSPEKMASTFAHALGSTGLLLVVASMFSFVSCRFTGAPWPLVMLAYSPGGITEACVTALALGLDTGFVAAHHLVRISSLILAAPTAHRVMSSALPKLDEKKRGKLK